MTIKKTVLIGLFLVIGLLSYFWYFSCIKNHSETIKKIGIPMHKIVLAFYEKHQRYPSLEESTELMEKAGCMNTRQVRHGENKSERGEIYERWSSFDCSYGFLKVGYYFNVSVGDFNAGINTYPYQIHSSKGNTRCSVLYYKDSTSRSKFRCYQDSCIFKNLSH